MTNREIKLQLIHELFNRGVWTKEVNPIEYRTRCPYCGDSERENTGHLYLRINPDDNLPVVFHCFKCEEKGVLRAETLSLLEIENIDLKSNIVTMNKTTDKLDGKNLASEQRNISFDYQLPEIKLGEKTAYLEKRLGVKFSMEDYEDMKLVTSLEDFLVENDIEEYMMPREIISRLEKNYVGFLTFGNSHILFRDITEKEKFRWIKYPITKKSQENRIFYVMAASIDSLSTEPITINLAEGVLDTLSVCYNLGFSDSNTMNISVSGKYYEKVLLFLIDLGFVGSNITVNIFADNDSGFNKKKNKVTNYTTSINYYRKILKNYKHLYGKINVYYNSIGKDVGVPREQISLIQYKL